MRSLYFSFFILILFLNCQNEKKSEFKIVSFDIFKITIPMEWDKIEVEGIDSKVGVLKTSSNDTISFDYGINTYKMEDVIKVFDKKDYERLDSIGFNTDGLNFSKHPLIDENQGTFHKEYYFYDTINGKVAKISIPKKIGKGITAVYFDNLKNNNSLYLYGKNLNSTEQANLLTAIKTIKFNNGG